MALPVALDACGADAGPQVVLEGARRAAAEGIAVRLFGPAAELGDPSQGVEVVAAEEWITNDEEPVAAVRGKSGASVVMAAADVAEGRSGALVSAGSTGATMTAALFALKRLQGVHRPALAAQVPLPEGDGKRVLFLDVGANTEVRPQHLIQFAHLGAAFSEAVLDTPNPRVALLSIGEEPKKGTPDVAAAHEALSVAAGLNFSGNVEGTDLLTGAADVIVTDGFTGNVALKLMEGTARAVAGGVRSAARSNPLALLGGLMLRPALGGLRRDMDPDATGGAILLGLRGVAVVAHGGSSPEGIANAARLADRSVRERAVERTAERLVAAGATREGLRDGPVTRA
ncbi:MAG: phosphate acyltransferase PlsX [Solirubrobacterales bacterium]